MEGNQSRQKNPAQNGAQVGEEHRMRWTALAVILTVGVAGCEDSSNGNFGNLPPITMDDKDPSVARIWNETLLDGIRNDFARPTVHARNLWHVSAAMYDAWAAYDDTASTWLLGNTQNDYTCSFAPPALPRDRQLAREAAISYAAYRLIRHRFANSPGADFVAELADQTMEDLGYDPDVTSTFYGLGSPAALGNYIAECYIAYGMADGANEMDAYAALLYEPFNPPIKVEEPGNPDIVDLNRWQQISLTVSIDQSGNVVDSAPPFVSPEWGAVDPFSLTDADKSTCQRDGFDYPIYYDPGPPPLTTSYPDDYKWTHTLVAVWSSHLDPTTGRGADLVDISPASLGNIQSYPMTFQEHVSFYDLLMGGTTDTGHDVNPVTGQPYEPQLVPLGDYARAIAEFWADGPDSETPPGHWFVITNTINDHPLLERRFEGMGPELGPLEWDVKLYFALGGAMHDAAITAWGIKGCYDYVRPVSAIRAMADRGQSTTRALPFYHPDGIPLIEGYIELVDADDPPELRGPNDENVDNKIKLLAWRGPDYINNPNFDFAGVGWILAENWWPYQRPTFVTPPFAGYISGHSTYSRTAAELLTLFTGDPYFPGGKSDFPAPANQFLVFEDGPSVDLTLEWATYRDASDQTSLSRIWGGIHPPADDIAGRLIGIELGPEAFNEARAYFEGAR
jgi:hypothetical protein